MSVANLGSIAVNVLARAPDITSSVSGNILSIIDEERLYMEERTGLVIGSVGIAEKFQPALTSLAIARCLELTKLDGVNASRVQLGDFTIDKRSDDNISSTAEAYKIDGERKLKSLGSTMRFRRVIG